MRKEIEKGMRKVVVKVDGQEGEVGGKETLKSMHF
jgi:hypothetical protein